ncbi:hypothetical protein AK812_SmicGene36829 [Symbiodinium microadriaticum]|uniref:Uncharacterized protein n=1 Tax=Symbiodinium microadriaticum TaxID=2951 RepID=A0A1Q9CHV7_SYMMI|nr:hypothetical protein AK812_SmicGene36829 [Symbiodinium microadriaticum]
MALRHNAPHGPVAQLYEKRRHLGNAINLGDLRLGGQRPVVAGWVGKMSDVARLAMVPNPLRQAYPWDADFLKGVLRNIEEHQTLSLRGWGQELAAAHRCSFLSFEGASPVAMTDYALGYSGASAAGALLSFLLTLSGFLVPWWTATEPAELAPIVTEVSLWTSNTRWTLRKDGSSFDLWRKKRKQATHAFNYDLTAGQRRAKAPEVGHVADFCVKDTAGSAAELFCARARCCGVVGAV